MSPKIGYFLKQTTGFPGINKYPDMLLVVGRANRDSVGNPGLRNNYEVLLLLECAHVINHVPDVLICNLAFVFGHLPASEFGLVEMLTVGL